MFVGKNKALMCIIYCDSVVMYNIWLLYKTLLFVAEMGNSDKRCNGKRYIYSLGFAVFVMKTI